MTGKRSSVARSAMRLRIRSRKGRSAAGVRQLALEPIGQEFEARPDVADDLGMREVDLLDVGRRVADVDHLRPALAHDEGRLLDRVVANGDDQVGLVDRLVHVVALGERGRAHVEVGPARHRALAHLGGEERDARAEHEAGETARWSAGGWRRRRA